MDMLLKDDHWCFACGTDNPHGLKLDDIHLEDDGCVCTFTPQRWHQGWAEIMHGGITATLLDEVMTHLVYRRGYDAVTAEMALRLKAPITVGQTLTARARISRRRRQFAETEGTLVLADGTEAATSTAKFFITPRATDTPDGPLLTLANRRAVILDLFGTLVPVFDHEGYFGALHAAAEALDLDPEQFAATFREDAPKRTSGEYADLKANIADIARRLGGSPSDAALDAATAIRSGYTRRHLTAPHADALDTLRALTDAGIPVTVISDCSPETPPLWVEGPLAEFVPEPVLSCSVGMRKPDPRIFALACERLGVDPLEAVYVGDGDSNELPGARAVGLFPVLIERGEQSAFRFEQCKDAEAVVHDLTYLLDLLELR